VLSHEERLVEKAQYNKAKKGYIHGQPQQHPDYSFLYSINKYTRKKRAGPKKCPDKDRLIQHIRCLPNISRQFRQLGNVFWRRTGLSCQIKYRKWCNSYIQVNRRIPTEGIGEKSLYNRCHGNQPVPVLAYNRQFHPRSLAREIAIRRRDFWKP
jgi:hypothetical protein